LRIDFPSTYSTNFFDIKINWRCVSAIPNDEEWHVSCSQRKVEVTDVNKVGCVGCDCCGSNLYWGAGNCKPCASPYERMYALMALGLVVSIAVLGVVGLMLKYELSVITKHLVPLSIFMSFSRASFSNFTFGYQWDSTVQKTASWMDSLIFVEPEGSLFNPACVDKTVFIFRMKLIFLTLAPMFIATILCITYIYMITRSKNKVTDAGILEGNVSSTEPLPSAANSAGIRSAKTSASIKNFETSNATQVTDIYVY
jgi:hypothetical protein